MEVRENQSVGDGKKHVDSKRINSNNWETALAGLKGKFCAGATIHLWGCNVGSCTLGANKLKEMADFFGVTVKGAVNKVKAGQQNNYSGPIQTATPTAAAPACMMPTDRANRSDCNQEGEMNIISPNSLDDIAANPSSISLPLSMMNVLSFNEVITIPNCGIATPALLDLNGLITFSENPAPDLINYEIQELTQDLEPFNVCGFSTGANNSVLESHYISSGTIDINTGEIIGTATVQHTNDLGSFLIPNDVSGTWFPTNGTEATLTFCGPLAAPSFQEAIPTLSEWGLIILTILLLCVSLVSLTNRQTISTSDTLSMAVPLSFRLTQISVWAAVSRYFIPSFFAIICIIYFIYDEFLFLDFLGSILCALIVSISLRLILKPED